MASPKASLTTSQGVSTIIAGIVGHFLFSLAWITLVLGVIGLLAKNVVFALIDTWISQLELTGDGGEGVVSFIETLRSALNTLSLVLIVSSAVSILIAFLISGGIMKAGNVRKPFGTTLSAMIIVAILDLGLFWLYLFIGLNASEETGFFPTYPIAFVIGTVVVGALVWLWMAHLRRSPLSEVEATPADPAIDRADGSPVLVAPDTPPVLDPAAVPPADAPVPDPVESEVVLAEPATEDRAAAASDHPHPGSDEELPDQGQDRRV
jgi:hypothetical protein